MKTFTAVLLSYLLYAYVQSTSKRQVNIFVGGREYRHKPVYIIKNDRKHHGDENDTKTHQKHNTERNIERCISRRIELIEFSELDRIFIKFSNSW